MPKRTKKRSRPAGALAQRATARKGPDSTPSAIAHAPAEHPPTSRQALGPASPWPREDQIEDARDCLLTARKQFLGLHTATHPISLWLFEWPEHQFPDVAGPLMPIPPSASDFPAQIAFRSFVSEHHAGRGWHYMGFLRGPTGFPADDSRQQLSRWTALFDALEPELVRLGLESRAWPLRVADLVEPKRRTTWDFRVEAVRAGFGFGTWPAPPAGPVPLDHLEQRTVFNRRLGERWGEPVHQWAKYEDFGTASLLAIARLLARLRSSEKEKRSPSAVRIPTRAEALSAAIETVDLHFKRVLRLWRSSGFVSNDEIQGVYGGASPARQVVLRLRIALRGTDSSVQFVPERFAAKHGFFPRQPKLGYWLKTPGPVA